jgi:TIR domain/Septum formation
MTMSGVVEAVETRGTPAHDVFVSYSTHDKPVADAIVSRLEQAEIRCWVAPRDIIPGRVWGEAIIDAIVATRLMVVVLSGAANASRQVLREVERAVANDVVVIPFRIESVEPTGAMAYFLASEHWLDAMTPPLDSHIAQLVVAVQALLGASSSQAAPVLERTPGIEPRHAVQPTVAARRIPPRILATGLVGVAAVVVLGLVAAMGLAPSSPATPSPGPEVRHVPETALVTGDCLLTPDESSATASDQARFWVEARWPTVWGVVACTEPHGAEVVFVGDVWGAELAYPGDAALGARWDEVCNAEFQRYVGVASTRSVLGLGGWTGFGADGWAQGLRDLACIAYERSGADLEGSIRGASR